MNVINRIKAFFIFPWVLFYRLITPLYILSLLRDDFRVWVKERNGNYSLWGYAMMCAKFTEFRSVIYRRLGWRKVFVSWLFHPQMQLTIACDDFGPGFLVQHGYCTSVCAERIGKHFDVNQCVNIVWNGDKQCTIGDNVMVCVGAIIVGGVHIGNNVTIGAGAVVVKDVPDNCTVVGNPMRIIKHDLNVTENNK